MMLALLLAASLMAQPPFPATDSAAPPPAHYRLYDANGKSASLQDVFEAMSGAGIVFIGETHDDPVAHTLEAELLRGAFDRYASVTDKAKARPLALSLEMFERDVQVVLDEYLAGLIPERQFLASSRPWNNYQTDYRPLVEFAREHQLPVLAANAPERYVNRAARLGRTSLDELSPTAKNWLAPLPYGLPSPAYAAKFNQLMEGMRGRGHPAPEQPPADAAMPAGHAGHSTAYLLDAQTLRDATMAYTIAEYLKRQPGALVLHVNGNFHSEERMGVPEQLLRYLPQTRMIVITIVPGAGSLNFDAARMRNLGDFVVVTDSALPRSF